MKKLPAKAHGIVMPFILTMLMTAIVSGISTFRVVGLSGLASHWPSNWLWSWGVAFPVLLVVMPLVRKIVSLLVEDPLKNP
jgi:energy-converting hydrogenase Eha subunit A